MRTPVVAVAVLALAAAACSEPAPSEPPVETSTPAASVAEGEFLAALLGPYRPAPIPVSESLTATLGAACAGADGGGLGVDAAALPVAVVDARGESRAIVILADEHAAVLCAARIGRDGASATIEAGPARLAPDAVAPIDDDGLTITGHTDSGAPDHTTLLYGRVGRAASKVIAGFDDEAEVVASMSNGWYATWWRTTRSAATVAAVDRQNVAIRRAPLPDEPVEGRVSAATWWVDPDAGSPARDATMIPAIIQERECASGRNPEGRVAEPQVSSAADAVLVTIWVRLAPGPQDCQGNPTFPLSIDLKEPLGDRRLLDGSSQPPRDATVPAG
jgi:hypothetical protein